MCATYVYGAYMRVNFSEPLLNTAFISTDLKNGEVAVLPAGQISNDDFAAYQDAIRGLYNKFADALAQPGSTWLKVAASEPAISSKMAAAGNFEEDQMKKISLCTLCRCSR
jgi:hypothetical protein